MQTRHYFDLIWKSKIMVVVVMLVTALIVWGVTFVTPERFQAETSMTVHAVNRDQTDDYAYDNYYSAQASEIIGNSLVGYLSTSDVVDAIYVDAELEDFGSIGKKRRAIKGRQLASHVLSVTVTTDSSESSEKVLKSVGSVLAEKVSALEKTKDGAPSYQLEVGNVVTSPKVFDSRLAFVVGLVTGFFIAVAVVFLREYLTDSHKK